MVNESDDSSKNRILRLLRDSEAALSGESIGKSLGISRVAVHKHIRHLREDGYRLEAGRGGYKLNEDDSRPFTSWEYSGSQNVTVLRKTSSTMDEAHRRALRHPGEDFILAAAMQTAGRGRREREWVSPEGGLWLTRVIHPKGSILGLQLYVMAAASALAMMLRNQYGIPARVKWPNDVLAGDKKIAGVLGEAKVSGDRISYLALGLGLNVNNETLTGCSGLKELLGREEDRNEVLKAWITSSDRILESEVPLKRAVPRMWNQNMAGIGSPVTYWAAGRSVSGKIVGVDSLGRLILIKKNGRPVHLAAGDIEDVQ